MFALLANGKSFSAPFELKRAIALDKSVGPSFYLIVFSTKNCPWCAVLKRDYLVHLPESRDAVAVQMLEVAIDQDLPLIDFKGSTTTHKQFSRNLGVRVSPTVIAFSGNGTRLGEPIVGVGIPDFYGAYLDNLIQLGVQSHRTAPAQ